MRPSARCWRRFRARCAPTCSTAPGRRRSSDGSGRDRETLRRALALFREAGYELTGTVLRRRGSGEPLGFEILVADQGPGAAGARVFAKPASAPASTPRIRMVDAVQYDAAPQQLRFRHDPESLGPVAVARQRAGVLLGLGRGRRARQPQLHGHAQRRRRRHDRGAAARRASAANSSPPCARSTAC